MEVLLLVGKILMGLLFVDSGISHFRYKDSNVAYARAKGLRLPELGVVASGIVLIVAPVLYIFGVAEVYAISALAAFLLITSLVFHRYWKETNPQSKSLEKLSFYKNISMFGMLLVILSVM